MLGQRSHGPFVTDTELVPERFQGYAAQGTLLVHIRCHGRHLGGGIPALEAGESNRGVARRRRLVTGQLHAGSLLCLVMGESAGGDPQ
jgi:hypothetical protein